jgi:arylformamidase
MVRPSLENPMSLDDPAWLDAQYNNRARVPEHPQHFARWAESSALAREKLRSQLDIRYGNEPGETLDVFPAEKANAPVLVFIHGGYWRSLDKADVSFIAPAFVEAGAICVVINFANIPKVRLPDMAHQVRGSVAWVHKNAKSFGGDPERIFISGHSSGGHLCGVALVTDWSRYGAPANVLKGGVSLSGMYDLHPVLLSSRSSYVKVSKEEEAALSSQRHLDKIACPVVVAHGDGESPEFKRQARDFAAALKAKVKFASELIEVKSANHFEMPDALGKPGGVLAKAALKQMGIAA